MGFSASWAFFVCSFILKIPKRTGTKNSNTEFIIMLIMGVFGRFLVAWLLSLIGGVSIGMGLFACLLFEPMSQRVVLPYVEQYMSPSNPWRVPDASNDFVVFTGLIGAIVMLMGLILIAVGFYLLYISYKDFGASKR